MQGERYNQYGQPVHSNNNRTDSHSSTNAMFSNSVPWGNHTDLVLFVILFYQVDMITTVFLFCGCSCLQIIYKVQSARSLVEFSEVGPYKMQQLHNAWQVIEYVWSILVRLRVDLNFS
ncbi:unnamed protein product [Musa textilis]